MSGAAAHEAASSAARAAARPALFARLRSETRAAHDAIERDLDWERRVSTIDGYRQLLARFYGFHRTWEPAIAASIDDESFVGPRRKLPLLEADLLHLGMTPTAIEKIPEPDLLIRPRTRAEALGSMYVLEGSTLGGQLIARRVAEKLGLKPGAGLSYHCAYGDAVGPMWQAFRARLGELSPSEEDEAIGSANTTFRHLRAWLGTASRSSR